MKVLRLPAFETAWEMRHIADKAGNSPIALRAAGDGRESNAASNLLRPTARAESFPLADRRRDAMLLRMGIKRCMLPITGRNMTLLSFVPPRFILKITSSAIRKSLRS